MSATAPLRKTEPTNRRGYSRGRFYETPDGCQRPSVTNILGVIGKPALINWAAKEERLMCIEAAANLYMDAPANVKMSRPAFISTLETRLGTEKAHRKKMREASDIGSEAHALIEWNLRKELKQEVGPQPHVGDKAMWAFTQWERWRESINLEPLYIEQTVWSVNHDYAGTLDLWARITINGLRRQLTVLDWKTGKAIYWEALLQNTAYAHAIVEMGHADEIPAGVIVRLPKVETDPEFESLIITPDKQAGLFKSFLCARGLFQAQQELEERDETWSLTA